MGLRMYTFELDHPRYTLTSTAPLVGSPRIAIVGSRDAEGAALEYARTLASLVVKAGGIVVSGGAEGVDSKAHLGALESEGRTWVIAPTGCNHVCPASNKALFEQVAKSSGAMVWPFPPDQEAKLTFKKRNDVLVALSDAVVVVQATSVRSGTFSTATKTLRAGKPLWVVPLPPWLNLLEGSLALIRRLDVKILWQTRDLLASVGLAAPCNIRRDDPNEQSVLDALAQPLHRDHLADRTGLKIPELSNILFTLLLEGLVRERIDGCVERLA